MTILVNSVLFSFTLLLLASALHWKDDPACHKSKLPPSTFIETCCPSLPFPKYYELFEDCIRYCSMWMSNPNQPGARMCCLINCTLAYANVIGNETLNPSAMIDWYEKNEHGNKELWRPIINKVISGCFEIGLKLKESAIKELEPQCETVNITVALNVTRCIRRELFFECKDNLMEANDCQLLKQYGKECLYWPWQCYRRKVHGQNSANKAQP